MISPLASAQLARRQHHVLDGHVAPALGADDRRLGAGRDQRRHAVGGRRAVAQVAAHGGAALDLRGADQVGGLDDARPHRLELGVLLELGAGDGGADAKAAALLLDLAQLGDALDVDHQDRVDQVGPHLHQQIGAACQHSRLARFVGEQRDRLVERTRRFIAHVRLPPDRLCAPQHGTASRLPPIPHAGMVLCAYARRALGVRRGSRCERRAFEAGREARPAGSAQPCLQPRRSGGPQ